MLMTLYGKKIEDSYNHLRLILEMLKYNDNYDEIRDEVTNVVLEKIKSEKSKVILSNLIISLVHFSYPAGRQDLIDQYDFSINKDENQKTFNMNLIFPLLKGCENLQFSDQVVSKAFKHLMASYAEEMKGLG